MPPFPFQARPRRGSQRIVAAVLATLMVLPAACKRHDPGDPSMSGTSAQMASRQLPASKKETTQVASSAFGPGATIPDPYSAYGQGISPPLTWTPIVDAQSYVLIVEDPDAPTAEPFVHWIAWNIPAQATSLPENLAAAAVPEGMRQGKNGSGSTGWFGPKPPAGPAHHYHFQVFALDTPSLTLPPSADRKALVAAMKGHVVAEGELVGLYQAKTAH